MPTFAILSLLPGQAIAQIPLLGGDAVPLLPDSPLLDRYLLERPIPAVVLLLGLAVAAAFFLNSRGKAREALFAASALTLLAAAVLLIARFVHTQREQLVALSSRLVDRVAAADSAGVARLLRDDAILRPFNYPVSGILSLVESRMRSGGGDYALKDHDIVFVRAAIDSPTLARSQLRVRVTPANAVYSGVIGSWWILHWAREGPTAEWTITAIECQSIDGIGDPQGIRP